MQKRMSIGVVEGFFGPAWSELSRKSYAEFLARHSGHFYIYAPKEDQFLRKAWREAWPLDYIKKLLNLKKQFSAFNIRFGIGFSPFAIGEKITDEDKHALIEKLKNFRDLGIDIIGLFFDDMPTNENLASTQLEVLALFRENFRDKIIFCPTYYTFDPILEKVFGKKPDHYLEDIATASLNIAIAWTGPKVISAVIDQEHLIEVTTLLKRKPFIWENFFANDGPKNCQFIKLKPYSGREANLDQYSEAFAFNLMNQAELSKINFLASKYVLIEGLEAQESFERSINELCSIELSAFIKKNLESFTTKGLDHLTADEKNQLLSELSVMTEPMALEIRDWLEGVYTVGSECLTD